MATDIATQLTQELGKLNSRLDGLESAIQGKKSARNHGAVPSAPPNIRTGENVMNSRGFSFKNLIASMKGLTPESYWQHERNLSQKMMGTFCRGGDGLKVENTNTSVLAPICSWLFDDAIDKELKTEMKDMLSAGVEGADPDEMSWIQRKMYGMKTATAGAATPAMSWLDSSVGGTFVPPPMFGQPIELLRNKEALLSAGATVVPLGPSGKVTYPRLTAATQGGWQGESGGGNTGLTLQAPVNPGTGQTTLSAKKVIALVILANELLRFGSPAAETMVRNDIFKTVSLIMDLGFLQGQGGDNVPLGLVTMGTTGIVSTTAGTISASSNGMVYVNPTATVANQLVPQDFANFVAGIEQNNGEPTGWIMAPQMKASISQARWTPYSGGTSQGAFTFDLTRKMGDGMSDSLLGLPITSTAQVARNRSSTAGVGGTAGSCTYVLCGAWSEFLVGMFGAIEFAQTSEGLNLMSSDQTLIRAILSVDGAPRYPGLFAVADAVLPGSVGP